MNLSGYVEDVWDSSKKWLIVHISQNPAGEDPQVGDNRIFPRSYNPRTGGVWAA